MPSDPNRPIPDELEHTVELRVNGRAVALNVAARKLLVLALRDDLQLTGTHVGCDTTQCGACAIVMNGEAVKSCTVLAVQARHAAVLTIEGFAQVAELRLIQEAFREAHGLQCGFCTPGMIVAAYELLRANADPTEDQVRAALSGNLCRCTGYQNIVAAVLLAARRRNEHHANVDPRENRDAGK